MRGLSLTLAILLSTAVASNETVAAQQRHAAPQKHPVQQKNATMPQPPPAVPPPTILPFPPLPKQPAGGLTPGVPFPFKDNPVYSPNRRGRGYGGGYGGGYYGGYYGGDNETAPATTPASAEASGMLRLTGTPTAAEVFVDGYYVGTLSDVESQRALTLSSGPHRIELNASGYTTKTFDVRIDPNETVTYRAALDYVRQQPTVTPTPARGPAKMYMIPNCYLGNVPPKADRLPSGCDVKRVQEIS